MAKAAAMKKDPDTYNQLWMLVSRDKLKELKKKVAGGLDPLALDEDGSSLLSWISPQEAPGRPMLEYLLAQGLPPDAPRRPDQPLLLGFAGEMGEAWMIELLLARGADPRARKGEALHVTACGYQGNDLVGAARLLIRAGADPD